MADRVIGNYRYNKLLQNEGFRRAANQAKINQKLLKIIAEQERIVKEAAQILNVDENVIVKTISDMKPALDISLDGKVSVNYDLTLRKILEVVARLGNTRDYLDGYEKVRKKGYSVIRA